jgi:23S rRNA pseudouridine1911/1915/1917 synthase
LSAVSSRPQIVTVAPGDAGLRLDKWLSGLDFIPSRSRAAELIERGLVRLNDRPLKASFKVTAGARIQIDLPPPETTDLMPLDRPLDILYEDDDLVVVNKPSGLVVHPAAGHAQDTLVNILLHHVGRLSMGFSEHRPGIVHRLDRDTSGILVAAKNDLAHHGLAAQFRAKTAHRIYWAIVHGAPSPASGTYKTYLARHPRDRKRFASAAAGKLAVTHYKVLQIAPPQQRLSWIQCRLETGRTHQIRVHLSEAGHPIFGDPIYGRRKEALRLALHACELGFTHPRRGDNLFFKVGWPEELAAFVRKAGFRYDND